MRRGFIYNQNKCVGCNACRAACILENGWEVTPRIVYTYNNEINTSFPLVNLSMACNHCEKPVCLEGCPSRSYYRDEATGAIVIDDQKCIGCKYCKWNCPYDAPKYDQRKKVIGKCNLCYKGLIEGRMPACTYACPTGALSFGDICDLIKENIPVWFPDKNINPAILFAGKQNIIPLRIVPEQNFDTEILLPQQETRFKPSLISLLGFSFLSTLSVSLIIGSAIKGQFPNFLLILTVTILAAISSLFHLGKASRAWRAVINIKSSPLSLEIALFISYSALSVTGVLFEMPSVMIISSIAGLLFLLSIDNVYHYAEKPNPVIFHSGLTFITSLLVISFLSGSLIPFLFIMTIKVVLSIYKASKARIADSFSFLRTFRIALLVISSASLIYDSSLNTLVIAVFMTGELIDRLLFYIDFEQLNIKTLINKNLKTSI
jgi:Fe-S-cluster-containing dehydrogenase component/DMSO reductase anchor subunit